MKDEWAPCPQAWNRPRRTGHRHNHKPTTKREHDACQTKFPLKLSLPQPCRLVTCKHSIFTLSLKIPLTHHRPHLCCRKKKRLNKLRLMRRQWEQRRHLCAMRGAKSDLGICTSQIQISHTEARKGDKQAANLTCVK